MSDQQLVTIWGVVLAAGTKSSGVGYQVATVATEKGLYIITFDRPFNAVPAVVATQVYPNYSSSNGGDTRDNADVAYISTTECRIVTGQQDGSHVNRDFSFVAIGV
jgi:hypothetical protein